MADRVPRRGRRALFVFLLVAGACRCDGDDLGGLEAVLDAPETVDVGSVPVGERARARLTLASQGTGAVRIVTFDIDGRDAETFSLAGPELPAQIDPGRTAEYEVLFEPAAVGPHEAILSIRGEDESEPLRIALRGTATAPVIVLCELDGCAGHGEILTVDLGVAPVGSAVAGAFRVENHGDARLRLSGAAVEDGGTDAGFRLLTDLGRAVIAPGGGMDVAVALVGTEQGAVSGVLVISSNDPTVPEARVGLVGTGRAAEPPRACLAVASVTRPDGTAYVPDPEDVPRARPGDRVALTAHPAADCSWADGDRPLTYRFWLDETPASSGARVVNASSGPAPGSTEPHPAFTVDAVGLYRVGLEVSDGRAASAPAFLTVDARPQDDLTIELVWTVAADLDLHLVAPGGGPFCSPLDCFWDTCLGEAGAGIPLLDWGPDTTGDGRLEPDGDTATDPILVFDNEGDVVVDPESGTRLETIRLQVAPSVVGGAYRIGVHFFADRGVTADAFPATVRVFRRGETLIETERVFDADLTGIFWVAAIVDAEDFDATASDETALHADYTSPISCD